MIRRSCLLMALTILAILSLPVAGESDGFDLYLVRHAEKAADGTRDPNLTPAGQDRARRLADWLSTRDIQAAWSSDYRRTRQTVAPLAEALNITVQVYDPGDARAQAERLLGEAQTALVAGHSNTIPELAATLCDCPVEPLDESEYDRLYHLRIEGDDRSLSILAQSRILNAPD